MPAIDELRTSLLRRRRDLLRLTASREDEIRSLDASVRPELEEEAQEDNIARLLANLDERGKAEVEAIDRALTRIARGDYGHCEECGEPIPLGRLEALPTATTCVGCAEARERAPGA
jgi:RNA polymerase-binding protein DksA